MRKKSIGGRLKLFLDSFGSVRKGAVRIFFTKRSIRGMRTNSQNSLEVEKAIQPKQPSTHCPQELHENGQMKQ